MLFALSAYPEAKIPAPAGLFCVHHPMPRALLAAEFLLLYVVLPLGYRFSPVRLPALPLLWLAAAYAWWQLLADRNFDRKRLWNPGPLPGQLPSILLAFVVSALLIWLGVRLFAPHLLWNFVRGNPGFWALVMLAYPVLSVYPQGVLYRAFFFQRYAALFPGKWAVVLASAAAFAFLHIVFRNQLAVVLTLLRRHSLCLALSADRVACGLEL